MSRLVGSIAVALGFGCFRRCVAADVVPCQTAGKHRKRSPTTPKLQFPLLSNTDTLAIVRTSWRQRDLPRANARHTRLRFNGDEQHGDLLVVPQKIPNSAVIGSVRELLRATGPSR